MVDSVIFAFVNLVIGTGAFVVAGVLQRIADALQVSISAAGQAMTAYALSTAFIVPFALVLTGKIRRKQAMQLALIIFTLGNIVCAFANDLTVLLLGTARGAGRRIRRRSAQRRPRHVCATVVGRAAVCAVGGIDVAADETARGCFRLKLWLLKRSFSL